MEQSRIGVGPRLLLAVVVVALTVAACAPPDDAPRAVRTGSVELDLEPARPERGAALPPPTSSTARAPAPSPTPVPRVLAVTLTSASTSFTSAPAGTPAPTPTPVVVPPDPRPALDEALGRQVPLVGPAGALRGSGVTQTTIRVGGVVSASLVDETLYGATCEGARARFERANRDGELTRRIESVGCHDDGADVDLSNGLVGALLRDRVFAVVPLVSLAFDAEEQLQRSGIPWIGWGGVPAFCGDTRSFSIATTGAVGCPVLEARGYVALGAPVLQAALRAADLDRRPGERRVVHLVERSAEGARLASLREDEAEAIGAQLVASLAVLPPPSAPEPRSWRAQVAEVLVLEPDLVLIESAGHSGLYQALRMQGYRGEVVGLGNIGSPLIDDDALAAMTPSIQLTQGIDPLAQEGDEWIQVVTDAFAAGVPVDAIDRSFLEGYLAADVFVAAAKATPEPFTAGRFHDTVNRGWYYPGLGDLACGGWWPAAHVVEHPCMSAARLGLLSDGPEHLFSQLRADVRLRFVLDSGED